jgi:hypothetical protein
LTIPLFRLLSRPPYSGSAAGPRADRLQHPFASSFMVKSARLSPPPNFSPARQGYRIWAREVRWRDKTLSARRGGEGGARSAPGEVGTLCCSRVSRLWNNRFWEIGKAVTTLLSPWRKSPTSPCPLRPQGATGFTDLELL